MYKILALFMALLMMATACGGSDSPADDSAAQSPPDSEVVVETAPLDIPGDSLGGIAGDLAFRERIAIEPGSTVTVSLLDVSGAAAVLVAEETINLDAAGDSTKFGFGFSPDLIQDGRSYEVMATVTNADGDLTWTTDTAYPVDFSDETTADVGTLLLALVGQDAPAETPVAPAPTPSVPAPAPTPTKPPASSTSLVGTWWVTSIDGKIALGDPAASLIFDSAGKLSGQGSCNPYSSTYTVDGNKLGLGDIAIGASLCGPAANQQEAALVGILNGAATYKVEGKMLTVTTANAKKLTASSDKPAAAVSVVGTWWVTAIDGKKALADPLASLIFDDAGKLNGSATCNSISSSYTTSIGNVMSLGDMAVTQRLCDDAANQQEAAVLAILNDIAGYKVDGNVLTLRTSGGKTMTASTVKPVAFAPAPVVGTWTVATIDGNNVISGSKATLVFDNAGALGGNASCNSYSTSYTIDGTKLTLGTIAVTASSCDDPANQQETAMLAVLNDVNGFTISGNVLTVTAANGKALTATR